MRTLTQNTVPAALGILLLAVLTPATADLLPDPCAGPSMLLAVLDRPTVSDSACVVPSGRAILEAGGQYGTLAGSPSGSQETLPNAELRIGLPRQTELALLPPNRVRTAPSGPIGVVTRGTTAGVVGLKHAFGYDAHWQWTGETLVTLPSGSTALGSAHPGITINGIVSYNPGGAVSVSFMGGVSSIAGAIANGGQRATSLNPDLVVTWLRNPRLQFYAEAYGQTRTAYGAGWGANADGGVQYLVSPGVEVDMEEGVRLQGNLGSFHRYTGVGLGLAF